MRRFEREVVDYELIKAMLKEMNIANIGMNDEDGFPYVVPLSFGFEMTFKYLYSFYEGRKKGRFIKERSSRMC